ncbi:MAG: PKD domain-containing protein [Lewinellaceae bacterium]|nr:PKD domain-containing protein [Lewinellaceae bacterium]
MEDIAVVADSACFLRVQCQLKARCHCWNTESFTSSDRAHRHCKKGWPGAGFGFQQRYVPGRCDYVKPDTVYSLRAYAVTASGTGYSSAKPFTTSNGSLLVANFTINTDAEIFQGADVLFTSTSVGATTYSWNFGDGDVSNAASPLHFYESGQSRVRLTAEHGGCMVTKILC